MSVMAHLLRFKLLNTLYLLRQADAEGRLRFAIGLLVLAAFFGGAMYFFWYIFDYLSRIQEIGLLLMDKIVSLALLAILLMLVISSVVIGLSTLYRSPETAQLFSLPLSITQVFAARFLDNLIYATWAVWLLGTPLIIAYGLVRGFLWWQHLFEFLLVFVPFMVIPASLGAMLLIITYSLGRWIHPRSLLLVAIAGLLLAVVFYLRFGHPAALTKNVLADWRILNSFLGSLSATNHPFLPNYWAAQTLRYFAGGRDTQLLVYTLALLSTAAVAVRVAMALAKRLYYQSWQISIELGAAARQSDLKPRHLPAFLGLPDWLPADFRSVLAKDFKLFVREPAQWAQFSILLVLLIIYLFNLRHFPGNLSDNFWRTVVCFANFAFTGFILATLSVRFVYPNISLEGKSFWVIVSSPMPLRRLFWEKFLSAFLIFVLLAEILAFVSNMMLGLSGYMMIFSFASVLLMSVSLTSLSVGLGAMFPRFEERNPGRIASSLGGTIATVVALAYVCLMVAIMALPVHHYGRYLSDSAASFPTTEFLTAAALMLILNGLTITIPLSLGLRSLGRRDF